MQFVPFTGPAADNVVEIRTKTPKREAVAINRQDAETVWVECENRCGNVVTEGKRFWHPVDFTDPEGPRVEVRLTAAPRRVCGACVARAARNL